MRERYWIFQNNQVVGPFAIEELLSRPDFSGDTLVCPEGRQGTDSGDWQRASSMPLIDQALSKPKLPYPQVASTPVSPTPEPSGDALLVKELGLLGAVHEKLGALGQSVSQMQESVKEIRGELSGLRTKFESDNRQGEDLTRRIKSLEDLSGSFSGLKEQIDQISTASRSHGASLEEATRSQKRVIEELNQKLESLSQSQNNVQPLEAKISDLNSRLQELAEKIEGSAQTSALSASLDELRGMVGGLKDEIAELRLKQESLPPVPTVPAPTSIDLTPASVDPAPTSFGQPSDPASLQVISPLAPQEGVAPSPAEFPPSPFAPSASTPEIPQIQPPEAVSDFILPTGNVPDPGLASSPTAPMEMSQSPALESSFLDPTASVGAGIPAEPTSLGSPSIPESPSELAEAPAKAPKKSKKGVWILILIVACGVLFALAYVLGLVPGLELSKPKSVARNLPVSSPAAPSLSMPKQLPITPATPAPLPPEQEKTFKDSAIKLVQNWPISVGGETISQALGATDIPSGDLSPWSAEKIKDNLYQVDYQTPPAMNGEQKSYEFQADLSLQKVVGQNQAALDLLSGKSQFPSAKKKLAKKRPPVKKKIFARKKKKVAVKKKIAAKKKTVAKKPVVKKTEEKKGDIMPGIPSPQSATNGTPVASPQALPAAQPQAAPTSGQSQNQELDQLLKP